MQSKIASKAYLYSLLELVPNIGLLCQNGPVSKKDFLSSLQNLCSLVCPTGSAVPKRTVCTRRYIPVRQIIGTWTARYRYSAALLQYEKNKKNIRYTLMYRPVHWYHTVPSPGRNAGMVRYSKPWCPMQSSLNHPKVPKPNR